MGKTAALATMHIYKLYKSTYAENVLSRVFLCWYFVSKNFPNHQRLLFEAQTVFCAYERCVIVGCSLYMLRRCGGMISYSSSANAIIAWNNSQIEASYIKMLRTSNNLKPDHAIFLHIASKVLNFHTVPLAYKGCRGREFFSFYLNKNTNFLHEKVCLKTSPSKFAK